MFNTTLIKRCALKTGLSVVGLMMSASLWAHPDASAPDFCPDGQVVSTSHHVIEANAMLLLGKRGVVECPVGLTIDNNLSMEKDIGQSLVNDNPAKYLPTHDVFDGAARLAYSYASCICASLINKKINLEELRPLLFGPASLVSDDHHETYQLSEGMSFSCNKCVIPRALSNDGSVE